MACCASCAVGRSSPSLQPGSHVDGCLGNSCCPILRPFTGLFVEQLAADHRMCMLHEVGEHRTCAAHRPCLGLWRSHHWACDSAYSSLARYRRDQGMRPVPVPCKSSCRRMAAPFTKLNGQTYRGKKRATLHGSSWISRRTQITGRHWRALVSSRLPRCSRSLP